MRPIIRLCLGLVAWAVVFSLVYALHGVGCEAGWAATRVAGTSLHRLVLLGTWIAGIAVTIVIALALARPGVDAEGGALVTRAARLLAWVSVAATVVGGLPIVIVPACV